MKLSTIFRCKSIFVSSHHEHMEREIGTFETKAGTIDQMMHKCLFNNNKYERYCKSFSISTTHTHTHERCNTIFTPVLNKIEIIPTTRFDAYVFFVSFTISYRSSKLSSNGCYPGVHTSKLSLLSHMHAFPCKHHWSSCLASEFLENSSSEYVQLEFSFRFPKTEFP